MEYEYDNPDHLGFVEDMEEAGLEVEHYRGRFFWEGPAVRVDDLQDALGVTKVRCQWDNMGTRLDRLSEGVWRRQTDRGRGGDVMGGELSRRVGLFVLGGPGAGIVFEKDEDGDERVPVRIVGGHNAARQWAEGHYEGLEWETPHRAMALVGRLATRPQPPPAGEHSAGDLRRLTYESDDLRAYLPQLLAGQRGPVILQQCEEYVPESGRWEPFTTILWESTW